MPTSGQENLAKAVKNRRAELELTHDQVLTRGGPSGVTLTKIESARGAVPNASTLKKLDAALDWEQGSAKRLLSGGSATPMSVDEARLQRVREGIDEHQKLFSTMLANYISMGMRSAKFIENPDDPAVRAAQAELADMMRKASRTVAVHFLVQLDPSWDLPEAVETASSILTEEDEQTLAQTRETFLKASALLNQKPGRPSNVTSLADRRPVPPPPDIEDLGVAASRREKQSDGDYERDSGWWQAKNEITGPKAVPSPAPEPIRAVVPAPVFHEHADAAVEVQKRLNAIHEALTLQRLTTDLVTLALNAIDDYGISSRRFMAELRRVELDATQDQIDSALRIFEQGWEYADSVSGFISELLPMAPDAHEADRIIAAQRSMEELAAFFHHAHDVWVESGRSSKSLKAATSRRGEQSDGERDDDE
ncbi:hypothetical protein [Mycobacteroides abscessus]|uniref:hypothetical protein n=1 Tax=Mycobacteroides abscessus TaxID=36809 RepID=UPI0012FFE288|nr:hypothetical protein [Mycobacteroides abscessus]